MNIIDLKLTSYWPCYPRQCIRMNEAFPIPTQVSADGICFEKCNGIIQRNTCVTALFLVCYRSCKNADSILLGTESHLALSFALHTNPPACATCLPGHPLSENLAYLLFPTQHCGSQRTQSEAKGFWYPASSLADFLSS